MQITGLVEQALRDGVSDVSARPFLIPAAGPCQGRVLLVHGFTATPWEMRHLGESLAGAGFTALGIRLPGHGTDSDDLAGRSFREWLTAVEDGLTILTAEGGPIYGIGMSTGGLLLALLARERSLAGLVLLSPFLRLAHPLAPFAGLLSRWFPFQERPLAGPAAAHYYSRRPLAGIAQVRQLTRELAGQLPAITTPTLVLAAEGDQTVDLASGLDLFQRLGSHRKEYHRFGPEVPHVLTTEENPRWPQTLELILDFLNDLAGEGPWGEVSPGGTRPD